MINLYSGTGGSGKSLHLARRIFDELRIRKKTVIANFPINMDLVTKNGKRKTGDFIYLRNDFLTVEYLIEYASKHHKKGVEGQTLVIIDEAGILFNPRDYDRSIRKKWVEFFMIHRHFGFNFILAAPFDRVIDRQIRYLIEYEIKHRKANNFRTMGFILTLLRIPVFVAITYWYGINARCSSEFFRFRKRDMKLYDTMMLFGGDMHGKTIGEIEEAVTSADGDTGACGGGAPSADEPPDSEQDVIIVAESA